MPEIRLGRILDGLGNRNPRSVEQNIQPAIFCSRAFDRRRPIRGLASPTSASMSPITTAAPASHRAVAAAPPIPRAPPDTRATLFCNWLIFAPSKKIIAFGGW
jgi:hypothetical protein